MMNNEYTVEKQQCADNFQNYLSTAAPKLNKSLTICKCPNVAAIYNAVSPSHDSSSTKAPALTNKQTASTCPHAAAKQRFCYSVPWIYCCSMCNKFTHNFYMTSSSCTIHHQTRVELNSCLLQLSRARSLCAAHEGKRSGKI
jgi:hypothetical protein